MADIVYMAKTAWTGLLDAIRAKSGKTDSMTVSDAQSAVEGIATGGIEIDDARGFFSGGARLDKAEEYIPLFTEDAKKHKCNALFAGCNINNVDFAKDILSKAVLNEPGAYRYGAGSSYESYNAMFIYFTSAIEYFPEGAFANVIKGNEMFQYASLKNLKTFPDGAFANVTSGLHMFDHADLSNLSAFPEGALANVTTGSYMFDHVVLSNLSAFPDGAFANVTNGYGMFQYAKIGNLKTFPDGAFANVTTATSMFLSVQFNGLTSFPEGALASVTSCNNLFQYAGFSSLTSFPEGAFANATACNSMFSDADFNSLTSFPEGAFANVTAGSDMFSNAKFNSLTSFPASAFSNREKPVANLKFQRCTFGKVRFLEGSMAGVVSSNYTWNGVKCSVLDLPTTYCPTSGTAFYSDSGITDALILRAPSVVFNSSPSMGFPKTLKIYVPKAIIDSYKSASNWSSYADQFLAIEDYTKDGTVTGDFDLEKAGITA